MYVVLQKKIIIQTLLDVMQARKHVLKCYICAKKTPKDVEHLYFSVYTNKPDDDYAVSTRAYSAATYMMTRVIIRTIGCHLMRT